MEILSLLALVIVIVVSCVSKVNSGFLALGLAWLLGYVGSQMNINTIAAGFPSYLFLILVGVTYLFGIAKHNGTLEKLAQHVMRLVKNSAVAAPLIFFVIAALLSSCGSGNIGAVALLAPIAMLVAWETGISAFFMIVILICGANAGAFSPFALTGIIANGLIAKLNIAMDPWLHVFLPNLAAQSVLALICYSIFYWRLKKSKKHLHHVTHAVAADTLEWTVPQRLTLGAIIILILSTTLLKTDIGFMSLLLGSVLIFITRADTKEAIKQMPWNTILMVCGVNTLIVLIENLGGLNLLTDMLAKVSNPSNVTAVTAFITGILSAFSSSSGVVLPTFIPLVPELLTKINGGNPVAVISSINVGAHLVDISPLSSLGAICLASAIHEDKERLFRQLIIFGLSMAFAGAFLCWLLFGWMK